MDNLSTSSCVMRGCSDRYSVSVHSCAVRDRTRALNRGVVSVHSCAVRDRTRALNHDAVSVHSCAVRDRTRALNRGVYGTVGSRSLGCTSTPRYFLTGCACTVAASRARRSSASSSSRCLLSVSIRSRILKHAQKMKSSK